MQRLFSNGLLVVGLALLAVAGYQAFDWWRQPSLSKVSFDVSLPSDLRAGGLEYALPLAIRNENERPITIYGEYTC